MRNERVFLKHGLRAVTMAMKTPIAVLGGIGAVALACVGLGIATMVHASSTVASNPVVQLGSGSVSGLGTSHVTVNQATQSLALTWASLGNQHGEVLRFIQPSASAVALNRVIGSDPSQFLGSLIANGAGIVINPNGVFIGPGSQVNVNGLIASTLNMTNASFLSGQYAFQGPATSGIVKNEGQITAGPYGVYLLARM
jgi:filamentous hemagglutinin family protein